MITLHDGLERASKFDQLASTLQLRRYEWAFLLALDGRTSAREIGKSLGLDDTTVLTMADFFLEQQLIVARSYSLTEYTQLFDIKNGATPATTSTAVNGNGSSAPTRTGANPISFSLKRKSAAVAAPIQKTGPSLKLKPIMDFVIRQSGGGTTGQIAAYRVLLKVPRPLLQAMKIESINFIDDNFELPNQEAYHAIVDGIKSVLNVTYQAA